MSDPVPHRSVNLVVGETPCAVLWLLIVAPGPPNDDAPFKLTDGKSEQAIKKRGRGGRPVVPLGPAAPASGRGGRPSVCLKGNPEDPATGRRPALFLFFSAAKASSKPFFFLRVVLSQMRLCDAFPCDERTGRLPACCAAQNQHNASWCACASVLHWGALGLEPRNPACRSGPG